MSVLYAKGDNDDETGFRYRLDDGGLFCLHWL